MIDQKIVIKNRIFCLDLLKAISISTVVLFHSSSNLSAYTKSQLDILQSPLRFCVPVLLTISFFLLKRSLENYNETTLSFLKKRFIRFFIPTIFWFSLATIITISNQGLHLQDLIFTNLKGDIFWGGYYLIILLQCLPILIVFNNYSNSFKNVLKTICLQSVIFLLCYILLSGAFGKDVVEILCYIYRPAFFYWLVYISLGEYFYNNWSEIVELSQKIAKPLKLVLVILTILIMTIENAYFHAIVYNNCALDIFEYLRFSCILSVFVAFLCFASIKENHIPLLGRKIVQFLSKYSLGIFCINGILSKFVLPLAIGYLVNPQIVDFSIALTIKIIVWPLLLLFSLSLSLLFEKLGLRKCVC